MATRRPRSSAPRPTAPVFGPEPLETRTLMAVNVVRGILAVRGTPADDVIEVRRAAGDASRIEVVENGAVTLSRPLAGLRQIRIDTGAGDDQVIVNPANGAIALPTVINGGRGDDLLRGGAGVNQINGGAGRDAYEPSGGRDRVADATRADRIVRAGSPAAFRDYLAAAARGRGRFGTVLTAADGNVRTVALPASNTNGVAAVAESTSISPSAKNDADFSQTTTQVAGVDEGDIIENDGSHLYVLSRGELLIIDARDADAPAVASRTQIEGWPIAEYLHGGRLTVLSSVWDAGPASGDAFMPLLCARQAGQVQVTVFDVADPMAPEVVSSTRIDGTACDSRMIDGQLVLVVRNDLLRGFWDGGPLVRPAVMRLGGAADALPGSMSIPTSDASLVRMVHRSPVNRLLPTWTTTGAGGKTTSGLVSRPQDILFPAVGMEANLTSIVTLDTTASAPAIGGTTSVVGGYTSLIHLDAQDLYLFSPRWNAVSGDQTDAQRFAIGGGVPRLVSTGTFAGTLLDQFSADSEDGLLRVAVTQTTFSMAPPTVEIIGSGPDGQPIASAPIASIPIWTFDRRNAVRVLATQGDTLRVVGAVEDIAPGEAIQSARFIGDRAYLCTFLQVDPLFTIDLSTPSAPRIVGELKVPGYSRFLLPFGSGQLLGIGRDADPATGRTTGLKVSLFDVRDDAAPREVSSFVIDRPDNGWSWSDAEWDVRALGLFTEIGVVALPVEGMRPGTPDPNDPAAYVPWDSEYGVVILEVDATRGITQLGTVIHDSSLLRTARIGSVIYSVADRDLRTATVGPEGITPRGSVELQPADPSTTGIIVY